MRIVHYLNQFFAGVGGEEAAGNPPAVREGAVGPGRALAALLGDDHEIVATVFCGDDYAASDPSATEELLALVRDASPELLVAGPAFTSGRYGLVCARLGAAATRAGIRSVVAMHPDNPGVDEAAPAPVIESGKIAREMRASLERLAAAIGKLSRGEELREEDGRVGRAPRRNRLAEQAAAPRAVELLVARLAGDRERTEVPLPSFGSVTPSAPIDDPADARIALLTEGALVPMGNPDRLESARATRWLRYQLEGLDTLEQGAFQSVHGGFSTVAANADPHRLVPLDVARDLAREGRIGTLHHEYLVTAGNGTQVATARSFGVEWAAELRQAGVQAAILTAT
jgi:glycine reductase complex component B subunit gamma